MANLVIGVVGDILWHVAVKDLEVCDIGLAYRTGCADSSQFIILGNWYYAVTSYIRR
jgi:hypothetical protein